MPAEGNWCVDGHLHVLLLRSQLGNTFGKLRFLRGRCRFLLFFIVEFAIHIIIVAILLWLFIEVCNECGAIFPRSAVIGHKH